MPENLCYLRALSRSAVRTIVPVRIPIARCLGIAVVEDTAQHRRLVILEPAERQPRIVACGFGRAENQNDAIRETSQQTGIREFQHWWSVDQHSMKLEPEA